MPLIWLSLAFLSGILLGEYLGWSLQACLLLAASALVLLCLLQALRRYSPSVSRFTFHFPDPLTPPFPWPVLLLVLALGAARYAAARPGLGPDFIAYYNDREVESVVVGVLVSPPDVRDRYANLLIRAERVQPDDETVFIPVQGLLLAQAHPGGEWRYGDRLRLQGQLQTPPEDEGFSYRAYLARQDIYAYLPEARLSLLQRGQGSRLLALIYALKEQALDTVYRLFPDPEASLLAGILLGVEAGIPAPVQQAFQATGTSHIIAISGFNMTIVAALFATLFGRLLGRRKGALAAAVGIGVYTLLVGANAAVVRAAIMGGLALFARQVGRRQHGVNSLVFVAALMALHNPNVPWDIGFQLSFMATLGLVLYAEPLSQAFVRLASRRLPATVVQRLAGPVGEYLLFGLAAQVMTLPVTLYHFGRLSPVSLVSNPFILPAQPAVMVLGGLAVLLGLCWLPLGQLAAYLAWPFVVYTVRAVELFAQIPGAELAVGEVALPLALLFYVLLLGWTLAAPRLQAPASFLKPVLVLALLGVLAVVVWRAALSRPDGRLHLAVLEVGGGDGLLIRTPTGRNVLVDGGASPSRLSDALGRRLPLGQRRVDWLVVAAAGEEQLAALPRALERFPAEQVLWSGPAGGGRSARLLQAQLAEGRVPVTPAQAGQVLELGGGARLRVLAVCRRGAVLLLEWRNFSALLPVGIDFDILETLQDDPRLVAVKALLLSEGGYAPANPPEWIEKLRPGVVLLSVAAGDRGGPPDAETMEAVRGYTVLRTDVNGWIEIATDGERMWVEVERR